MQLPRLYFQYRPTKTCTIVHGTVALTKVHSMLMVPCKLRNGIPTVVIFNINTEIVTLKDSTGELVVILLVMISVIITNSH